MAPNNEDEDFMEKVRLVRKLEEMKCEVKELQEKVTNHLRAMNKPWSKEDAKALLQL